jgi:hypothetical protein
MAAGDNTKAKNFARRADAADIGVLESLGRLIGSEAESAAAESSIENSLVAITGLHGRLVASIAGAEAPANAPQMDHVMAMELAGQLAAHVCRTLNALAARDQARAAVIDAAKDKEKESKETPRRWLVAAPGEVIVNFKFGKGTSKEAKDRDKMVKNFLDSLQKHLVKDAAKSRFGKTFREAKRTDVDVPEKVATGNFTKKDDDGNGVPGTYEYDKDAIELVKKHGSDQDQLKITVIIVHNLGGKQATTFTSKIRTKNGDQLGTKEAIIYDESSLLTPSDEMTPAHEAVHLGGLPDAPSNAYPGWGKLNSYDPERKDDLRPEDEKQVKDYFDGKMKEVKE